jgi:hypothetical protein
MVAVCASLGQAAIAVELGKYGRLNTSLRVLVNNCIQVPLPDLNRQEVRVPWRGNGD